MSIKEIDREQWKGWMDGLSRELSKREVHVPVAQLPLESPSTQTESRLIALVYDPPGDMMTISTDDFDHFIDEPTSLGVDLREDGVCALHIMDPAGQEHHLPLSASLAPPALDAHHRLIHD